MFHPFSSRPSQEQRPTLPCLHPPRQHLLLLLFLLGLLISSIPSTDAAFAVRVNDSSTLHFQSWDPFQGESPTHSLSGILVLGDVQKDCTVRVNNQVGPTGNALLRNLSLDRPVEDTMLLLRYDWLDNCATFDEIFKKLSTLDAQLASLSLPSVGAVVMDGDALNNEDFGSPFIQLADAKHWNQAARLNISFTGSDTVLTLAEILQANYALLATTASEPGPWNRLWHSVGMNVIIRGLDVTAGLIFVYGIWVLFYVVKAAKDDMNYRRYLILVPGIIYLPLSIAFAPYKVTVPWRNAVYYLSLLFPFISLGLQITMWSKLVYRIKRKKANKLFSYYSYVTIFVPVISSFLDGIGWLIPSVPIIRMIGERGFSYVTPAVILVQAGLIFYYAVTFFRSLKGIAISTTTRTALVKITVLNMAMISFFVLMLLSRIVSVMGLNMRSRAAYLVELIVFRFSFLFFYAACFRTLAIRQPTGSTVDSKGASSGGGHLSGTAKTQSKTQSKSLAKNQNQYAMDEFGGGGESSSSSRHDPETGSTPSRLHYNKHLSNHASKGFTIPDPSNPRYLSQPYGGASGQNLTQGYVPSSGLMHSEASRHNLNEDYPDPYKFGDFGHLTHYTHGEAQSVKEDQSSVVSDDADKESVYGGHRFPSRASDGVGVTGSGRVVGTKPRNSEGYSSIP